MDFHEALGDVETLPESERPLFSSEHHEPKRPPGPRDWLATHDEPGQSFEEFIHSSPNTPDDQRDTIYMQPLGSFAGGDAPSLDTIERFGEAFFQTGFEVRDPLDISGAMITEREHPQGGQRQLLTGDILSLLARQLPSDAFCMVGITMVDLYPDPSWNFVFGQASLRNRVGVYSFARYAADDPRRTLERSMKVMAHETGHMFGIGHCTYFECLMNGSNHLQEADRRPAFLCPVDLRKLMWSVGFDPRERYRELGEFYEEAGFTEKVRRASGLAESGSST